MLSDIYILLIKLKYRIILFTCIYFVTCKSIYHKIKSIYKKKKKHLERIKMIYENAYDLKIFLTERYKILNFFL